MDCIVLIDFGQDAFAKAGHEVLALLPTMDLAEAKTNFEHSALKTSTN